ncbi:MAG: T9SS type A sorting domain-containing protein [Vicingaceae bacterium]|nr:T9SS type A sorting domain-containing protein [Vicingaceae bacterium]
MSIKTKAIWILLFIYLTSFKIYGVSPSSVSSVFIDNDAVSLCGICSKINELDAIDNDILTFANYNQVVGALAYHEVTYDFGSNIPTSSVLSVEMSYPSLASGLGNLIGVAVFNSTTVELLDASNLTLATYNVSNQPTVELLDSVSNRFKIQLINMYSNVKKIRVTVGGLSGLVSLISEARIYEVKYEVESFNFVNRNIDFGYYLGANLLTVSANNNITNKDYAIFDTGIENYDVNNKYTLFSYLSDIDLGNRYLFSSYDWNGSSFDGATNDLYIFMEDNTLISLSDLKLLFSDGNIRVKITYSDLSTDIIDNSSSLVSVNVLSLGSGRFYLQIDLNDAKSIKEVEVRFAPTISTASSLRLYSIFVAPVSTGNPLPVKLISMDVYYNKINGSAEVFWSTATEINCDYFKVVHLNNQFQKITSVIKSGNGNSNDINNYSQSFYKLDNEVNYFELYQYDFNGTSSYLGIEAITVSKKENIVVYPNPTSELVNINIGNNNSVVIYSITSTEGKIIESRKTSLSNISLDLSTESKGTYFVKINTEYLTEVVKILKQ